MEQEYQLTEVQARELQRAHLNVMDAHRQLQQAEAVYHMLSRVIKDAHGIASGTPCELDPQTGRLTLIKVT